MDTFLSPNKIYSLASQEGKKQEIHVSHSLPKGATLATQNKACKGHQFDGNYDDRKKNKNRSTCEHCGKEGHTKIVCYNGHPPKQ